METSMHHSAYQKMFYFIFYWALTQHPFVMSLLPVSLKKEASYILCRCSQHPPLSPSPSQNANELSDQHLSPLVLH